VSVHKVIWSILDVIIVVVIKAVWPWYNNIAPRRSWCSAMWTKTVKRSTSRLAEMTAVKVVNTTKTANL